MTFTFPTKIVRDNDRLSAAMVVFAIALLGLLGCEITFGIQDLAAWASMREAGLRGSIQPDVARTVEPVISSTIALAAPL